MSKVSIVIPVGPDHAACVDAAIRSCLNQSHEDIEVIVIDDHPVPATVYMHGDKVVLAWTRGAGVCEARNTGLRAATGDFIMFLDADDTIEPTKVERQLRELAKFPDHDWCLCDVLIRNTDGTAVLASERYRYKDKELGGWIYPLLRDGNFIPIMSPMVRTSLLRDNDIWFDDRLVPEDYHFWMKVAKAGRVRYVPEVLATYNKSKTGRNQTVPAWRRFNRTYTPPLRLNLGCGTQGTRSWHPIEGFYNLDKSMGWKFEDGLGDFVDESVAGITISHAAMYIPIEHWPFVFSEFYRVLRPGGVIRITEDEALKPESSRFGGWKGSDPAVTLTGDDFVWAALLVAGFEAHIVGPKETFYEDGSLVQQQHGDPPDVFFVEGVKRA